MDSITGARLVNPVTVSGFGGFRSMMDETEIRIPRDSVSRKFGKRNTVTCHSFPKNKVDSLAKYLAIDAKKQSTNAKLFAAAMSALASMAKGK